MASLKHFKGDQVMDHFCAGSLIYENYILTAAHCVYGLKAENFVVVLGLHYLNESFTEKSISETIKVRRIILHENYNHKDPNYDIALIKLKIKVKMSKYINTICLPESSLLADSILNENAIVAGWGRDPSVTEFSNRKLQQTFLKIINGQQLCSKHLQTFDYSNLYCAYDTNQMKNSNVCECQIEFIF
jgi:secreted trypsin-like serine protease